MPGYTHLSEELAVEEAREVAPRRKTFAAALRTGRAAKLALGGAALVAAGAAVCLLLAPRQAALLPAWVASAQGKFRAEAAAAAAAEEEAEGAPEEAAEPAAAAQAAAPAKGQRRHKAAAAAPEGAEPAAGKAEGGGELPAEASEASASAAAPRPSEAAKGKTGSAAAALKEEAGEGQGQAQKGKAPEEQKPEAGAAAKAAPAAAAAEEKEAAPAAKDEPRTCQELPSVRLGNGEGSVADAGKDAADPHACVEACRKAECGQAIFSSGNKGCYLFRKAVKQLKPEPANGTDVFTSAVCGPASEIAARAAEFAARAAESAVEVSTQSRKAKLAEVQAAWADAERRAKTALASMQPYDKYTLVAGTDSGSGFAGYIGGTSVSKPLKLNDGPQGFNIYTDQGMAGTTTQFPCLLAVSASFDPEVSAKYAAAIVEEFAVKGANVLLGPDLEVTRVASTGRSFETLTGEDPYLGSRLVETYIGAVQSKGIIATIKHWLDNNQEIARMTMNVEVSDRAQHEIYMPAFKAAIDAGAGAVMCSYNKIYGTYACENEKLLKQLLRKDAGFRGFVMSDWGATHNAEASVKSGLDVEMPGGPSGEFAKLQGLVGSGTLQQSAVDDMALHVLTSMYAAGHFDGRFAGQDVGHVASSDATSEQHRLVAKQTITSSAVLLKNEGSVLPLATAGKKIAFIGQYCNSAVYIPPDHVTANVATPFMGQGSGYVQTSRTITPVQAFQAAVKDATSITFSNDASAGVGADVAIVCASACDVHEGWDRGNFSLPEAGDLLAALRKQDGQKKVVVFGVTPGAVTTEWMDKTDAAIILFMPGEQVGPAVAELLTGAAEPGGRLPVTMPPDGFQAFGGYPVGKERMFLSDQYPGTQPPPYKKYDWGDHLIANFTEGVLVGYRWFDATKVKPAFPFGHGLAYTNFTFKDLTASCVRTSIVVSLTVANKGQRNGAAVPQLYVSFPSLLPALRTLKGFKKLQVPKESEAQVQFVLGEEDVSYYDEAKQRWVTAWEKGESVTVSVGKSSGDLVWHKALSCGGETVVVAKE